MPTLPTAATKVARQRLPVTVSAARNETHEQESVGVAVRSVVEHLDPPLSSVVRAGDRVLVKVNMGCHGFRDPTERMTSHPAYVQAIIECLLDCGARVTFGDDVARSAQFEWIWRKTGMTDVASRTGAQLADFVQAGGREVRGFLQFPRTHLITNLVFDADVIVNAASCRSLPTVVLSGAIKNMFGVMLGVRKQRIHNLFPNPSDFARVIVDVHRVVRPAISFLDLTSVIEGAGLAPEIRPVGLILGSTDPVALDTVAAQAVGYGDLTMWTSIHANSVGLGTNQIDNILVEGMNWGDFQKKSLRYPELVSTSQEPVSARVTRRLNNTIFRPRPVISTQLCTGCGACTTRCPVGAIRQVPSEHFLVDLGSCADCGCSVRVCDAGAVRMEFVGVAKLLRRLSGKLHTAGASHHGPIV
jgi:uncharacterized protein (DUF362 family)/Pyruvate/2-oxoacid:ferredoxin oxidoreductase delta subunit